MDSIIPESINPVVHALIAEKARPYVAGGAVRDKLLGRSIVDVDFEVYDLSVRRLVEILSRFGHVETVGKSFGVIKLWGHGIAPLDFALPRRESKVGRGHRGFVVACDAELTMEEACARRDFTINAMLLEPLSGEIFDFFGGQKDLVDRVLRHTSERFVEDPLRPLRAMQFAGRFDMKLHPDTAQLCRTMLSEAITLPEERIYGEWEKWAIESVRRAAGLRVLWDSGWLSLFPRLAKIAQYDVQDAKWEDGLWGQTVRAVDRVAELALHEKLGPKDTSTLVFSALCLSMVDADAFLKRIGAPGFLRRNVPLLVDEKELVTGKVAFFNQTDIRRLAQRLQPVTIYLLGLLMEAWGAEPGLRRWEELRKRAADLGIERTPPERLVMGRDLIALGISPGPQMGELLQQAFEAQLAGEFETREDAMVWAKNKWNTRVQK